MDDSMVGKQSNLENPFKKIKFLFLFLISFSGFILFILVSVLLSYVTEVNSEIVGNLAVYFIVVLISIWFIYTYKKLDISFGKFIGFQFEKNIWKSLLYLSFIFFLFQLSVAWFYDLILYYFFPSYLESRSRDMVELSVGYLLASVLIFPIIEELFFRGFLLRYLTAKWNWSLRASVIFSSLIVALLHQSYISTFLFGILMCIMYLKSKTLLLPIVYHIIHNTIVMSITFYASGNNESPSSGVMSNSDLWIGLGFCIIIFPIMFLYLKRNKIPKETDISYFYNNT
jgi:membrane protease YdiL (CAAX protease family)